MARAFVIAACAVAIACAPQSSGSGGAVAVANKEAGAAAPAGAGSGTGTGTGTGTGEREAGVEAGLDASVAAVAEPTLDEIVNVLFADKANTAPMLAACAETLPAEARIRCLYDERYRGDAKATGIAHELFVKWKIVAGVEVAHTMDGGYRGIIKLEPAVPVAADRKHLEWVAAAIRDFDTFFAELEKVPSTGASTSKRYRFHPIMLRFMRSVAPARNPAAYAHDWTIAYNFASTINISADMVRETMFHEVFHLNDAAHGGWSPGALGAIFDVVAKKCGTSIPCLTPYTPNETIVRGGTYYSFQPGNGVMEYAAELALRYYREQRIALRNLPKVKAFKCGPPENAQSWKLIKDEFFSGIDATPPCP